MVRVIHPSDTCAGCQHSSKGWIQWWKCRMFAFVHKEMGTGNMEEWIMKEGQEEIVEACYKLCNIGGDFIHLSKNHIWCDHLKKNRYLGDFRLQSFNYPVAFNEHVCCKKTKAHQWIHSHGQQKCPNPLFPFMTSTDCLPVAVDSWLLQVLTRKGFDLYFWEKCPDSLSECIKFKRWLSEHL